MTTHDPRSPSAAHRWTRCAGSVREEAKYPEPPPSAASIDGTHTHTLVEHCVKASLSDPTVMVGVKMKDHDGVFVVDADSAHRAKQAIDYVRQRVADQGGMCKVLAEQRVNPAFLLGRDDCKGTIDIQIHGPQMLEIIDYKDGMGQVEVVDNEQLELYAIGALAELKLPVNGTYPFQTVRMTVIQPKMALKGLPPITSHDLSVTEIMGKLGKYAAAAAATDAPDAPLTPGEKQCRWCKASGCTARTGAALAAAGVSFPVVGAPAEVSEQIAGQDVTTMDNDRLRQILEAAPLMRQTIEQAEAEALRRLELGQSIPGVKLVNGRGSQVWNLPEEQIAEKLKGMGVPKDAVFKTSVVPPAQAKKLSWENRKGEKKTLSERQLKTLETEYISKLGGKLTVALESDPRPAVVRDASALFSAVEQAPTAPALPAWMLPQ